MDVDERSPRERLEAWAATERRIQHLGYQRDAAADGAAAWTVRIEIREVEPVSLVVVTAVGAGIEAACRDAIAGLGEYGIEVP